MFQKLEKLRETKLRGGIFGQATWLLIVIVVCFSGLAASLHVLWAAVVIVFAVLVTVIYALNRLFNFADKNPLLAIVSGAQAVEHARVTNEAKGIGQISSFSPSASGVYPEVLTQDAEEPDSDDGEIAKEDQE